jgi:hypothetical protein
MAKVLTTEPGSTVKCGHGLGKVLTSSSAKLTVNNNPVLLENSINHQAIDPNCSTMPLTDPPPATTLKAIKCTQVTGVTGGQASKLTVGKKNVILDTLAGNTNGMVDHIIPQTHLKGKATQSKLTAK